jgi:hypothetical protein
MTRSDGYPKSSLGDKAYVPNAVQSIVRAKGLYLAKQVKSDTWRIVGRPCGQFHGWSIVLICCTICIPAQVKAIPLNRCTTYRIHPVHAQRFSYHDAFSTRTHGKHRSCLGTSYHCSYGAVMHEMDELFEICTDVSTSLDQYTSYLSYQTPYPC